ncbi:MAG: MspA family porin [Gordonia sp. (in: high G+C Gram-positive bacteria)]|uniref:MspA family porin n=1 Tax=Gordonia sp. (in: high G+C Gram-positive bacteria) TaxID=84139 RepID=UPI0039E650D9
MRKNLMRNTMVAVSAAAIGATSLIAGAGAADAARLPGGSKTTTGIDGQVVKLKRSNESFRIQKSVANNGAGRATAVSGTYTATINKGEGMMNVGYLVGCQVDITGLEGGLSGSLGFPMSGSLSGSLTVPLNPGQVAFIKGDKVDLADGKGVVMVDSFQIDVQQCGGYASARSVVKVMAGEDLSKEEGLTGASGLVQSTLYGRPFSIG